MIESTVPLVLSKAVLDSAVPTAVVTPTVHSFRAGADWREPDWTGPPFTVGDPHAGTWRETRSAGAGEPLAAGGQWLTLADGARSAFMVMERNDLPSSRLAFDGRAGSAVVDFSRDVLSLGPFEEQAHVENPFDGQARVRVVRPGRAVRAARGVRRLRAGRRRRGRGSSTSTWSSTGCCPTSTA